MIVNCCLVCNRLVRKLLSELMLVLLEGIVYRWVRKYLNCIFFNHCNHNDRKCIGLSFLHIILLIIILLFPTVIKLLYALRKYVIGCVVSDLCTSSFALWSVLNGWSLKASLGETSWWCMKGLGQGCMEGVPTPHSAVARGFQQFWWLFVDCQFYAKAKHLLAVVLGICFELLPSACCKCRNN